MAHENVSFQFDNKITEANFLAAVEATKRELPEVKVLVAVRQPDGTTTFNLKGEDGKIAQVAASLETELKTEYDSVSIVQAISNFFSGN